MRSRLTAVAATAALVAIPALAVLTSTGAATADDDGQVCLGLTSGKVDTTGDPQQVTAIAPLGTVITRYCVKAGSGGRGDGPVYVDVADAQRALVIQHPSGKAVSHYSYVYAAPGASTPITPLTPSAPSSDGTSAGAPSSSAPTSSASSSSAPDGSAPGENPPATDASGSFDWNWRYADPSCTQLTVAYPSNIPTGQSNDINVRVWTDTAGEVTLNYHHDEGTWAGTTAFVYSQHPRWPAAVREYAVTWTQVAGSNYHFGEKFHREAATAPLRCRLAPDGDAETHDAPLAVSGITGWRTGAATVVKGSTASADLVAVAQPGLEQLALQKQVGTTWRTLRSIAPRGRSTTVTFPRETRRGTSRYRLVLPGSESITGATTGTFTVRVR